MLGAFNASCDLRFLVLERECLLFGKAIRIPPLFIRYQSHYFMCVMNQDCLSNCSPSVQLFFLQLGQNSKR